MTDRLTKCKACDGRGYFRCECWPGDCICGNEEELCQSCFGEGSYDATYDDYGYDDYSDPEPSEEASND